LLDVDSAQTSCGFAVPNYQYQEDRGELIHWTEKIGDEGVKEYWKKKTRPASTANRPKFYNELTPNRPSKYL
jgi:hypothetical protein